MPTPANSLTLGAAARHGKAAMLLVLPLVILLLVGVPLSTIVQLGLVLLTAGLLVCLFNVAEG